MILAIANAFQVKQKDEGAIFLNAAVEKDKVISQFENVERLKLIETFFFEK